MRVYISLLEHTRAAYPNISRSVSPVLAAFSFLKTSVYQLFAGGGKTRLSAHFV
jgi:hypothetical protein